MISHSTHTAVIPVCIRGKKQNVVKAFRKNIIIIGKPMYMEKADSSKTAGMRIRDFSREIMQEIKKLSEDI